MHPVIDDKEAVERFQIHLNRQPKADELFEHPHAKGYRYLPISYVQMSLDETFLGIWEETDFRWQIVGNEIVGTLHLRVFHPVARVWITRIGTAATMIRQASGSKISDIDAKQKNALEMDFPHLKSDCLKSAAKSLGLSFGRDLNRKIADVYHPLIKQAKERAEEKASKEAVHQDYLDALEFCTTLDAVATVERQYPELANNSYWRRAVTDKKRKIQYGR